MNKKITLHMIWLLLFFLGGISLIIIAGHGFSYYMEYTKDFKDPVNFYEYNPLYTYCFIMGGLLVILSLITMILKSGKITIYVTTNNKKECEYRTDDSYLEKDYELTDEYQEDLYKENNKVYNEQNNKNKDEQNSRIILESKDNRKNI